MTIHLISPVALTSVIMIDVEIPLAARAQPSSQTLSREVGDEVVLMSLATDAYFGLDGVGRRVWQLLADGQTVEATITAVTDEYGEARERVESDVVALVGELAAEGLIEIVHVDRA